MTPLQFIVAVLGMVFGPLLVLYFVYAVLVGIESIINWINQKEQI